FRVEFEDRAMRFTLGRAPGECLGEPPRTVRLELVGARSELEARGDDQQTARIHHLRGRDRRRWLQDVPTYGRVVYREAWPGIDVVFRGSEGRLEYDLVLAAGADPARAVLAVNGSDPLRFGPEGEVVVRAGG